jgi:hypothetical protein
VNPPAWFHRWLGTARWRSEQQLRTRAAEGDETLWIAREWLDDLGRERVQQIVAEYDYGPLQGTRERTLFG